MNQNGMSNSHRGPSIDASYQVSVYLPSCVRKEDFQKLTIQKKELSVVAMFVNRLGQNEQSL
jgi:hypothetical protein